jgi:hypothetical protein
MLGAMETVLGLLAFPLLLGIPLAYAWLQVRALRRWVGAWRFAAAVPVVGWVVWGGDFARDVAVDPTSHNLFPFEILVGVGLATAYLCALALGRWLAAAMHP